MEKEKIKAACEAVLFACGGAVEIDKMASALDVPMETVRTACEELSEEYRNRGSGIRIARVGDAFRMCSEKEHADIIRAIMDIKRNTPLSQAASEVLAVIAYNQPITKAYVEQVRGVDCSGVIANLISRELIEEKGRLELPGRPLVYGTTDHFLLCFGISSLDELPPIPGDAPEGAEES